MKLSKLILKIIDSNEKSTPVNIKWEEGPIDVVLKNYIRSGNKKQVDDDELLTYEPIATSYKNYQSSQVVARNSGNTPKQSMNLERQSSPVAASTAAEIPDSPNVDKFSSIAHNSREVRLIGPLQKEVEMKDDIPSKMVIVIENLSKEATEVWGQMNEKLDKGIEEIKRSDVYRQVNEKLDKGWTDFKGMVGDIVAPATKKIQP